ncbi:MAG: hypothetical protein U0Q55_15245 [Vicinamibacterales bacterium]
MTHDELFQRLRDINAVTNPGVFRARLAALVQTVPSGMLVGEAAKEFDRAFRGAKRDGWIDPKPGWACTCGHDFEWHEHGLHCESCACVVFSPVGEKPVTPEPKKRHRLEDEAWFRRLDLPEETQQQLRLVDFEELQRKKAGSPSETPWQGAIKQHTAKPVESSLTQFPPGTVQRSPSQTEVPMTQRELKARREDEEREKWLLAMREAKRAAEELTKKQT